MQCQSIFQYSIIKKALIQPTLQGFWVKQCGIKVTPKKDDTVKKIRSMINKIYKKKMHRYKVTYHQGKIQMNY